MTPRLVVLAAWLPLLAGGSCATTVPTRLEASATVGDARPAPDQALVWLDFDDPQGPDGDVLTGLSSTGTESVGVSVVTLRGGLLRRTEGPGSAAALMPPWRRHHAHAAAVEVTAAATATSDPLELGDGDFEVGADFRLDTRSEGGRHDDGDNLVQRGLYVDGSQVKLQVDHGVPSCRVAGDAGALVAAMPVPVRRGRWYRVRCARVGDSITLRLSVLGGATSRSPAGRARAPVTVLGPLGRLSWPAGTPLAVGAKASADGTLVRSETDQFNGAVDDVYLALLPSGTP